MSNCTHGNMTAHGNPCPWCEIAKLQAENDRTVRRLHKLDGKYVTQGLQLTKLLKDEGNAYIQLGVALAEIAKLEARITELTEAAKNRLRHGHHILCMSIVKPTKGALADIEPPEKYACDCGHDKLAELIK